MTGAAEPDPSHPSGVQQALRGLLGCEHAALVGLTQAEREDCRERLAAAAKRERGSISAKLDLGRRGAFTGDPEPYLERRPKNGCKARAGGDVAPMGQEGAATGIACSWSF